MTPHGLANTEFHATSSPLQVRGYGTQSPLRSTALSRRAIARRERPHPAIGIDAKSCSEFRAEEVPLLIIDRPAGPPWLRRTNVRRRVTSLERLAKRLTSTTA